MITMVHHIALIVSSEECLEFYKILGFIEFFRKIREDDEIVLMVGYGIQLEIFVDGRHPVRPQIDPLGLRHFALKTSDPLEKEIERLRSMLSGNLEFGQIMFDWQGTRFVFLKDPDGNVIELHE